MRILVVAIVELVFMAGGFWLAADWVVSRPALIIIPG